MAVRRLPLPVLSDCRSLLATVLLCGLAAPALAQTRPPRDLATATIEDLMDIVVTTASRAPEQLAAAPARVQVITAAQIERRGYRSLLEVLKDLVDFKVDFAGDPDYPAQLAVDGTTGAGRVVILLDGIRISSPTNEPLPLMANYPVHNAAQVEVLYGPASALYGADAFSAVINIVSKTVAESPGLAASSSIGQAGLYNETLSYGVHLGAHATLMLSGQFFYDHQPDLSAVYPEAFGGLQAQHTGVFPTIFGPMISARPVSPEYDVPMSAHSVHARLQAGGLDLSLFESGSRTSTTPPYLPDDGVYNSGAFNKNSLIVASGSYMRRIGRLTSTSTLMFSRHELDPQSGYWNVFSNMEKSFKYAYGSMAKAEEQLFWALTPSITLTAGGTFERFFAIPQGADLNAPIQSQDVPGTILDTNIPDAFIKLRYFNTGAYAQMQFALTPRVTLMLGAREDYNSRFGAAFNPRLGLVARLREGTTLKVLYGSAFLAPSPYQAFSHYGSFDSTDGGKTFTSGYWHVPNPDLKPETKRTAEANVLQRLGRNFQFSASAFYSRFSNLIQQADPDGHSGVYLGWPVDYMDAAINEGYATAYGTSLALDYVHAVGPARRIEAHAAVAIVDGQEWKENEIDSGVPAGAMSPVQWRFGADIDWDRWRIAPRLTVVGTQRFLATTMVNGSLQRATLPGYATVDVNLRRNVFRTLDAFVTIENAFDRRYRTLNPRGFSNPEEMVGVPQNPRRVSVGFSLHVQ